MNVCKKILSCLMSLAFIFTYSITTTNIDNTIIEVNAESSNSTDFNFDVRDDTVSIKGLKSGVSKKEVVIPDSILGYPVTSVGAGAFEGNTDITSVSLPDSIIEIRNFSFKGCSNLKSINIPNDVISIDSQAFSGCSSLTSLNMPQSLERLGKYAFEDDISLSSIELPSKLDYIPEGSFKGCTELEKVKILSKSMTYISSKAFYECYKLKEINLPDTVFQIEAEAFRGCRSLKLQKMPKSLDTIGNYCFSGCSSFTDIVFSSKVSIIDECAFYNCPNIREVHFCSINSYIGEKAFGYFINDDAKESKSSKLTVYSCPNATGIKDYAVNNDFTFKSEHVVESTEILSDATCTKEGSKVIYYACGCEETETIPKDKLKHNYEWYMKVGPTAFSGGYTAYKCTECGSVIKKNFTPKINVPMSKCIVSLSKSSVNYTGKKITPAVTVKYDTTTLV